MQFNRLLNEYIVDDIFHVKIFSSVFSGIYYISIVHIESGEIHQHPNIESVPTFGMIENFIKLDFNYGN